MLAYVYQTQRYSSQPGKEVSSTTHNVRYMKGGSYEKDSHNRSSAARYGAGGV